MTLKCLLVLLAVFLVAACAPQTNEVARVEAERLSRLVKVLASDEFEGRAPDTAGEQKTVAYLITEFEKAGVDPAAKR